MRMRSTNGKQSASLSPSSRSKARKLAVLSLRIRKSAVPFLAVLVVAIILFRPETSSTNNNKTRDESQRNEETHAVLSPIPADPRNPNSHTNTLMATPVGWDEPPKAWIRRSCPEVIEHYQSFPSFAKNAFFHMNKDVPIPLQTTSYALQTVCILKILNILAASIQSPLYLHAGSHLGAVLHGQPIPWDDDVDVLLPFEKKDDLLRICGGNGLEIEDGVFFKCLTGHNGLKAYIQDPFMTKETQHEVDWLSPFVDIFVFRRNQTALFETFANGTQRDENYLLKDYFPTQPYYFAGIFLNGPARRIATTRYDPNKCVVGYYNHRRELWYWRVDGQVDCSRLRTRFPFIEESDVIQVGDKSRHIFPRKAANVPNELSVGNVSGQFVDMDNQISNQRCDHTLKVVTYSVGGGRRWIDALPHLKGADVILLTNMDAITQRADGQHATRLLAYLLEMNYVWGPSTRVDNGGFLGNAILSKCALSDPLIIRNQSGDQTGIISQIHAGKKPLYVGVVKRGMQQSKLQIFTNRSALILGSSEPSLCDQLRIRNVGQTSQNRKVSFHICTNLKSSESEEILDPRLDYGFATVIFGNTSLIRTTLVTQ